MTTVLDPKVAADLRARAQALATSLGLSMAEAKQNVWAEYQREEAARAARAPPDPSTAQSSTAARWNDTGSRSSNRKLTTEQRQIGKQHVQTILGVIAKGRSNGT
ncbi:hypothetical protein QWZ03_18100 [Chitinimonas viridis]|uniref:Uncharacterized protein n=1 Tax=Chitinimonas viridis TaxID=664880 RepID=A0ABT8BA64_9NEIS|nr:hypothetical protein [Chitinimonas viridis]MDN3578682.1 hypothetical protein [Chitinimonas viridis]